MKNILLLLLIAFTCWSCEKDEDRITVTNGTPAELSASANTFSLAKDQANQEAVTFSWTPADYGYKAAIKYTLQFDTAGNDFAGPTEVNMDNSLQKKYTVAELNDLAGQMKLAPAKAEKIEVRVKAEVSSLVPAVYSTVIPLTITSYEKGTLYVLGSYPGGDDVSTAVKIGSAEDDGRYEGYIYFPDAVTGIKFQDAANIENIYGGAADGALVANGDAINIAGNGYYLLQVNLNNNTWTADKSSWGLIGSATPGGWDRDSDMTYDPAKKLWYIELNLVSGLIKFRANDSWDLNYGDNNGDLVPDKGGSDIPVQAAGKYRVELNISTPGNYTYSLRKL